MPNRKLKLDMRRLSVESFPTETVPEGRGTVDAHLVTWCKCTPSCDAFDTLPLGECTGRCDGTTGTEDTQGGSCTWDCNVFHRR